MNSHEDTRSEQQATEKVRNAFFERMHYRDKTPHDDSKSKESTPKEKSQQEQNQSAHDTTLNPQHEHEQRGQSQSQENILDELIEDFDTDKPIEQPELIGGMFIRGYSNWLVGQSGGGKSWQVLRWCKDISRGGEIFGGFAHNMPPRKCLILAGELPADEIKRRAQILEKGGELKHNRDNLKIIDLKNSERRNFSLMLSSKKGQENLVKLIQHFLPDIIFIDSLLSFFEGSEAKYEDMKPITEFLERITNEYNIAVVVVHHIRKRLTRERMNPLNQDDVIGSSSIIRKAANIIGVEFNPETEITTVTCLKSWLKKFKPFTYKLVDGLYGGLRMDINLNVESLKQTAQYSSNSDWKLIVKAFLRGKGNLGASAKEINDTLNMTLGTDKKIDSLYTQLKRMADDGEIIKLKNKRGFYTLPEDKLIEPNIEPNTENEGSIDDDSNLSIGFDVETQ